MAADKAWFQSRSISQPLASSSGTISAKERGEKRPWWWLEKVLVLPCSPAAKWQSCCHGSLQRMSYNLAGSGNREDWSRLICFFCGRSSSLTGIRNVRERANVIADLLFHAHCCVINVTSEVESFGNFPLPAGSGWATGIAGWQRNPSSGTCDVLPQSISASHSAQQGACSSTFSWIMSNKQNLGSAATAGCRMSPLSLQR